VAERLQEKGHRCFAPTLRGLAHRKDLLTPELDADAHVEDVANLIEALDLRNVILVLHSYAGLLGPALQARLDDRLDTLCLIEAVVPRQGQGMLDLIAPSFAQRLAQSVADRGLGWRIPPPDPAQFQLGNADLAEEVSRRLTPHPWRSFQEPVRAPQADVFERPGSYVLSSDRDPQPYADFAVAAMAAGWKVTSMPGGHLLMLTQPAAIAQHLLSLASKE
jgi:pimeloyl-ACP methyl ester carboxylesterase